MTALVPLAQALGIAFASGISPYATVALLGLGAQSGVVGALPAPLEVVGAPAVIALALALTLLEFVATLVPGVASAWDAVHTFIRPPAAAAMALFVAWSGGVALFVAAGLLGGTVGLAAHATKLGARVALDASPAPVSNGMANAAEFATVALIVLLVGTHPFVTLAGAALLVASVLWLVRRRWRAIRVALTSGTRDT